MVPKIQFTMSKLEIKRDITGFEGYYSVTNTGIIYSLPRQWEGTNRIREKAIELKPAADTKGYLRVTLTKGKTRTTFKVHRLVAMVFIPNPENKPQVNHKNGIKTDNRAENLEWCTNSENTQHSYDTGLTRRRLGEAAPLAKLTYFQAEEIRNSKNNTKELAGLYNVSISTIKTVKAGKSYVTP